MTEEERPVKIRVASPQIGVTGVRLLRVDRTARGDRPFEIEIDVRLEGAFTAAFVDGGDRPVPSPERLRDAILARARAEDFDTLEDFGLLLGAHFVREIRAVTRAAVQLVERPWAALGEAGDAFVVAGEERRTARVIVDGGGRRIRAGVERLSLLGTDAGTPNRVFATRLDAIWDFREAEADGGVDFGTARRRVRDCLTAAFAEHAERSVQAMLYAMGEAVLRDVEAVWRIRMVLPEPPWRLADLAPHGLDNPGRLFVPDDEPAGRVEAVLERT